MNETRRIALEFAMRLNPHDEGAALENARKFEAYIACSEHADVVVEKSDAMIATLSPKLTALPSNPLLGEVEVFLSRFGVKPYAFSFAASGDSCFVKLLRKGRISKPETTKKIRQFMREIAPLLDPNNPISSREFMSLAARLDSRSGARP